MKTDSAEIPELTDGLRRRTRRLGLADGMPVVFLRVTAAAHGDGGLAVATGGLRSRGGLLLYIRRQQGILGLGHVGGLLSP